MSTPTRGARTTRTTGGEFFHEFEYEDWEEVDVTRPVPIWISLLLVFGILFGGKFSNVITILNYYSWEICDIVTQYNYESCKLGDNFHHRVTVTFPLPLDGMFLLPDAGQYN